MAALHSEIVVGIDFGTTNSGVSWAVNAGARTIRLIDKWPHPMPNSNLVKVPSVIAYKNGLPDTWGHHVEPNDVSFSWIKILLEPGHKFARTSDPVKKSSRLLVELNKTAHEVVADYLRLIWKFTIEDIKRLQGEDFQSIFTIKVVLTVPAMWSPQAKDRTKKAAIDAGMPEDHIELVTEPEAAALATLKDRAELNEMKVGDAFVVCDAGGGTVDLVSYQIVNVDPLEIKECAIGEGDLCGSVFVDLGFQQYVINKVGENVYSQLKEKHKQKMLNEFEWRKKQFTGESTTGYSVELRGVEDRPPDIVDELIMLKPCALRTIFDHVCLKVENLVGDQIDAVKSKNIPVKAILLVGGFGESVYLYERLRNCHKSQGIKVLQTQGAWSAICRGATMWGLESSEKQNHNRTPSSSSSNRTGFSTYGGSSTSIEEQPKAKTVQSRLARYSYGLKFSVRWDPTVHSFSDRFFDNVTQEWRADQMEWLIKRGDEIKEGKILHTECAATVQVGFREGWSGGSHEFGQFLYYCSAPNPPLRPDETCLPLCKVEWSIPNHQLWLEKAIKVKGQKIRQAEMLLLLAPGSASMEYFVTYRNELIAYTKANYIDQSN